jgi:DHA2 family multidrug resistance protein
MTTAEIASETSSGLQRALVLLTLTMVTMLYAMTVTIANVALPQMQGSLSATQDQIAWVVTFNIVATAVATPMAGWLANRFGRRRLMIYAVLGFAAASLLCGMAGSVEELVLYRIAQGACGAPLVPLSQAIVVDTYPKHQHGTATAIWGVGVILGPIIAPTLGGYLSETYNWRWVFFMIVPFAVVSLFGVLAFITARGKGARGRPIALDWTGFLALSMAIAAFQLMLDRGERNDWFQSTETMLEAGLALAALYVFVVHSLTASKPFLNPRLLRDRNFSIGLVIILLFGMLNFTAITLLPTLLQNLRGYPDSIIGLVLAARGVGTLAGFIFMMFASRLDPRIPIATGFVLQALAGWAMAQFGDHLLDARARARARRHRDLPPLAPHRQLDPHLAQHHAGAAVGQDHLFRPGAPHHAPERELRAALGARTLDAGDSGRAGKAEQRGDAPGDDDRLYQRLLSLRLHRLRGHTARLPDPPALARRRAVRPGTRP